MRARTGQTRCVPKKFYSSNLTTKQRTHLLSSLSVHSAQQIIFTVSYNSMYLLRCFDMDNMNRVQIGGKDQMVVIEV